MEEQRRNEKQPEITNNQPTSPPTQVEEQSLQQTMDKNKESLKRKLMLRRSVNELVDQGIYPSLKTPPAFAEQRKQLERAKTGDLLRQKLKQRPDRLSLVEHHILEDTKPNVDPSLQEKQRLLKKARLQDSLTDRLANRPGPLELVQGNILQADPELKDALQEGTLVFTKTADVDDPKRRHFQAMDTDDSNNTSDGFQSPQPGEESCEQRASPVPAIPTPPDITPLLQKLHQSDTGSPVTFTFAGHLPPITSQSFTISPPIVSNCINSTAGIKNGSVLSSNKDKGLSRIKKKTPKPPSKSKVIKFHEYKGPPSVVKNSSQSSPTNINSCTPAPTMVTATIAPSINPELDADNTPYHIMLQQQQLFLQWQLEFQQKNMPLILPASTTGPGVNVERASNCSTPSSTPTPTPGPPAGGVTGPSLTMAPTPPPLPLPPPPSSGQPIHTTLMPVSAVKVPAVVTNLPGEQPFKNFAVVPTSMWSSSGAMSSSSSTTVTPLSPPQSQTVLQPIPLKITKLEDMKVADLKVELKKRNLPVSGPKPQLIERLKLYSESISSKQQQSCSVALSSVSAAPSACINSVNSVSSISAVVNEVSLTSPSSINNLSGIINIQPVTPAQEDTVSMTMSPPMSPCNSLLDMSTSLPLALSEPNSPENFMDVQSPSNTAIVCQSGVKAGSQQLGLSQTISHVKMDSHLPRPPSAVPRPMSTVPRPPSAVPRPPLAVPRPPSAVPMEVDQHLKLTLSNTTAAPSSARGISGGGSNSLFVDHNLHPLMTPGTAHGSTSQSTPQVASPQLHTPPHLITHNSQVEIQPKTITIQPEVHQLADNTFQHMHTSLQSPPQQLPQPPKATTPMSMSSSLQMAQQIQQIQANLQAVQASMQQAVQQAQLQQAKISPQTAVSTATLISSLPSMQNSLQQTQTSPTNLMPHHSLPTISAYNHGPTGTASEPHNTQGLMQIHVAVPSLTQQQQVVGQPQVISPEELLRQQQKQIDDLRQQLMQSQQNLQEAQRTAVQHQEQLNVHLAQVQAQALKSAPQSTIVDTRTDSKVSVASTPVLHQPVYAHIQIQPVPTQAPVPQSAPALNKFTATSSSPTTVYKSEIKPSLSTLNNIIQTQAMQRSLLSQNNKLLFNVMQQPNGQQVIFTSQPNAKVTLANHILNNQNNKANLTAALSINGSTPNNKASSVPSSPVGHPKIQRTSTNPFFSTVPRREPPKYDEAVKNKQQSGSEAEVDSRLDDKGPSSVKSQAMDDVLEILIRNGELPPSAAQEPPPTPKSEVDMLSSSPSSVTVTRCLDSGMLPSGVSSILIPASSSHFISNGSTVVMPKGIPGLAFSSGALVISTNTVSSPVTTSVAQTASAVTGSQGGLTASAVTSSQGGLTASAVTGSQGGLTAMADKTSCTTSHKDIPIPLVIDTPLSSSIQSDLPSAFTDGLPSSFSDLPFISMDWSDSDLPDNLLDTSSSEITCSKLDDMDPDSDNLLAVYSHDIQDEASKDTQNGFVRGSEPNLAALGLNDVQFADAAHAMNIDVSDWLDVIMPSTGLTPMSTSAPTAFPSDPILTPKPQDVLDLFNMDESDLYTPTELGISFEKVIETSLPKI